MGKAGVAYVEIKFNPGDLERMMAEAKAAGREIADSTSKEVNKNSSIWKSLLSNWKLLVPAILGASVALLGFTGNMAALLPLVPVLTAALGFLLAPLTTLAAIFVGFIPPVTLLVTLLGGLGVAFGLAGARALKGGGIFTDFAKKVEQVTSQFKDLIYTLGGRFLPIFNYLADSASHALHYLNQIAKLPLKQAFDSFSTTGVAGIQKFLEHIGHILEKPLRLAFKVAFGEDSTLRAAMVKDWNAIWDFLTKGNNSPGHFIAKWFGKQDFTAVGMRWATELAGATVSALGAAFTKAFSSRGGKLILGGAGAGVGIGAALGGPIGAALGVAIGTSAGIAINHYWPKIIAEVHKLEGALKRAIGPGLWKDVIHNAELFWANLKEIWGIAKRVFAALGGWHTVEKIIAAEIRIIVGLVNAALTVFNATVGVIKAIASAIKTVYHAVKTVVGLVSGALSSAWDGVSSAVGAIVSALSTAVGYVKDIAHYASQIHFPSIPGSGVVDKVKSLLPHTGGVVGQGTLHLAGGGFAFGGIPGRDSVPALLTPGEMVLNASQQKALFRALNNGGLGGGAPEVHVYIGGKPIRDEVEVVLKQSGRRLQAGRKWSLA